MSIRFRCFVALLLLTLTPSCQRRVKYVDPLPGAPVVVRGEVSNGEDWVVEFNEPGFAGTPIYFGEAHSFKLGHVEFANFQNSNNAIYFEVVESERSAFWDCTSRFAGGMVAFEVEGEIRDVFLLVTPLPGGGVISAGESGFTKSEANELIESFKGVGG